MQPSTEHGLGNSAEETVTLRLRGSRPASACSSGARSRSSSRPTTPKWVPVALEQKLQHYRDDPRALEQLNRRVKEYSRPSSPRKTPTAATAAARPVAPWATAAQSQSSSRPSSAPASPQSDRSSSRPNPADAHMASTEHSHCAGGEQEHIVAQTPAGSPVPLSPVQLEQQPHATTKQQHPQQQHEAAGPVQLQDTKQDLQQQLDPSLSTQQPHQGPQPRAELSQAESTCVSTTTDTTLQDSSSRHDGGQHSSNDGVPMQLQEAPLSAADTSAAGDSSSTAHIAQDSSQDSHQGGSSGCDAALHLQQLLDQHEQQDHNQFLLHARQQQQRQQQQDAQDEIWHQIEQVRLNQQATFIQKAWRSMRFVKAARLQLLCHAMLRLEHQIIRSNESAARAAARAEARAQVYAAEAAAAAAAGAVAPGRGGLSSLQGGNISASAAAAAAAIVAAEGPIAAAVAEAVADYMYDDEPPTAAASASHHVSVNHHSSPIRAHSHNHLHPRHSAPPSTAAAAAEHTLHPGRVGGPLVLPGDFFDSLGEAGESPKAAKLAPAKHVPVVAAAATQQTASTATEPAASTALATAGSTRLRSAVRPKSASVAVSTFAAAAGAAVTSSMAVASSSSSSSSSSRPQSAVWPKSPTLTAAAPSSGSRPQSAYARPHTAFAWPQSAAARPQFARPSAARPVSAVARPSTAAATAAASGGHSTGSNVAATRHSPHPPALHQLQEGRGGSSRPASAAVAAAAAGGPVGNSRSSRAANPSSPPPAAAAATVPTAAAAALPEGPMPSRGVQITGQLTPLTGGPDSEGNLAAFADAAAAFAAAAAADVGIDSVWVQAAVTTSGSGNGVEQQQQGKGRQKSGGLGAAVSGGVVWNEEEGVVDLEIEAQLKTLTEVLPSDVRQQVAQEQLVRARKQLLEARELHAARMASYRSQLAAEAVLHQTLTAVAGDSVDLTSKLEPPPPPPCMRIIPGKQELKELVAAAMDLHQEKLFMAACADSDTLNPQPRKPSGSGNSGSSNSRANSVSGGRGLSMSGGRFNM